MRTAEANRAEAKRQAQQEIEQFEQEFQGYLGSDGGKLQYVKENNLKPVRYTTKTIGGSTYSGSGETNDSEQVRVPVYQTPYGEVEDLTGYYERIEDYNKNQLIDEGYLGRTDGRGFQNIEDLKKNIPLLRSLSSPSAFINPRSQQVEFSTIEIKPEEQMIEPQSAFQNVVAPAKPKSFLQRLRTGDSKVGQTFAGLASGPVAVGLFAKNLLTPSTTKDTIVSTGRGAIDFTKATGSFLIGRGDTPLANVGRVLRDEPQFATGAVAGELLLGKGIGLGAEKAGQLVEIGSAIADPRFRPVVQTSKGALIQNVPSKFSSRGLDIPLSERIPTLPLSEQAKIAGTNQNVVSGARSLFGLVLDRELTIAKPIPKQELLTKETATLLKQFDEGTLPKSRIVELDNRIKQETGSKGLLERTFFGDPSGILRPSRLGLRPGQRASIVDVLSDDVSLSKGKPQAILFEKQAIKPFPSYLKDIEEALINKKSLTLEQQGRLLKWQVSGSGNFKPIGFVTPEAEVVARGVLQRDSTAAVTLVQGRKVPIIRARLITNQVAQKIVDKIKNNLELSQKEKTLLKSITGFTEAEYKSYKPNTKPFLNPLRLSGPSSLLVRQGKSKSISSKVSQPSISKKSTSIITSKPFSPNYKPLKYSPYITKTSKTYKSTSIAPPKYNLKPSPFITPKPSTTPRPKSPPAKSSIIRPPVKSPPGKSVTRSPPINPPRIIKPKIKSTSSIKIKNRQINRPAKFDVFDRKGKRLNPIPFNKKSAEGFGKLKTDTNIKASFFIKPTNRSGFRRSSVLERTSDRLGFKFQASKRTPGLIVEKNRFRLEKRTNNEVKEIQAARKSSLGFKNNKSFGKISKSRFI